MVAQISILQRFLVLVNDVAMLWLEFPLGTQPMCAIKAGAGARGQQKHMALHTGKQLQRC